jgi:uncharacterized protein YgbK (DUF1537 family)
MGAQAPEPKYEYKLTEKTLIVLGSSSQISKKTAENLRDTCPAFVPLTCDVTSPDLFTKASLMPWIFAADEAVKLHGYAFVAIDQPVHFADGVAARLVELMALLVECVIEANDIENLVIEGGATASSVLRQLGYKHFKPVENIASGVIALHELDTSISIITKVGSYPWPDGLLPIAKRNS